MVVIIAEPEDDEESRNQDQNRASYFRQQSATSSTGSGRNTQASARSAQSTYSGDDSFRHKSRNVQSTYSVVSTYSGSGTGSGPQRNHSTRTNMTVATRADKRKKTERKEALMDDVMKDLQKNKKSVFTIGDSGETEEDIYHEGEDRLLTGEERIVRATTGSGLRRLIKYTESTVNKDMKKAGTDARSLLQVVVEDELLVNTCMGFPLTVLFFCSFVFFFQVHYGTVYTYIEEAAIRDQITNDAIDIQTLDGITDWLANSWFPTFWSLPGTSTGTTTGPLGDQTLVGGVLVRTARGPHISCPDFDGFDCFPEKPRIEVQAPVLNGWTADGSRRLSDITQQPAHHAHLGGLLGIPRSGSISALMSLPGMAREFRRPPREEAEEAAESVAPEDVVAIPEKPTRKRRLKKSVGGVRPRQSLVRNVPRGAKRSDQARAGKQARRLRLYRDELSDSLPEAWSMSTTYTKVVPMSMDLSAVQAMVTGWQSYEEPLLTNQTTFLGVETILKNDAIGSGVVTHVYVNFLMSRGGAIYVQVVFQSNVQSTRLMAWLAFGVWVVLMVGYSMVMPYRALNAAQHGACCSHFLKFSNFFEWVLIIMGWFIILLLVNERMSMSTFMRQYEDYQDERGTTDSVTLQEFDESWFRLMYDSTYYSGYIDLILRYFVAYYHIILVFRFLLASRGHVRLAVVVNTISRGFLDLLHFLIVEVIIITAFFTSGHIFFGHRMEEFASMKGSLGYTFRILFAREYEWTRLTAESPVTAGIWVITYLIMALILLLNIVLAMIFDNYGEVRVKIADDDTVWHTARQIMVQMQQLSTWVTNHDLLCVLTDAKQDGPINMRKMTTEYFPTMSQAQVAHLFDTAKKRMIAEVTKGSENRNMLSETIASILVGISDLRHGVRMMKDWRTMRNGNQKSLVKFKNEDSKGSGEENPFTPMVRKIEVQGSPPGTDDELAKEVAKELANEEPGQEPKANRPDEMQQVAVQRVKIRGSMVQQAVPQEEDDATAGGATVAVQRVKIRGSMVQQAVPQDKDDATSGGTTVAVQRVQIRGSIMQQAVALPPDVESPPPAPNGNGDGAGTGTGATNGKASISSSDIADIVSANPEDFCLLDETPEVGYARSSSKSPRNSQVGSMNRPPDTIPMWLETGVLEHLRKQQNLMLQMHEMMTMIQTELKKRGVGKNSVPIPVEKPAEPKFTEQRQLRKSWSGISSSSNVSVDGPRTGPLLSHLPPPALKPSDGILAERLGRSVPPGERGGPP